MTENECISYLRMATDEAGNEEFSDVYKEMCQMAIKALEEIQAYRAIGTVEQLKTMFDGFWKLKDLCEEYEKFGLPEDYWKLNEMCKEYSAIGTIEDFKALKEKSEPKKAIGKRKYDEAYCPACNEVISDGEFWALDEYVHHCNYCGQAVKGVDWQ